MLPFFKSGDIDFLLNSFKRTFDVITMTNVLEHVLSPESIIEKCIKLLSRNGVLVITVPNDFSYLQKKLLLENKISQPFWVSPPEHLSYFTKESLTNLMEAYNLKESYHIGDYPIDFELLVEESNYINHPDLGKVAHKKRIAVTNLMAEISIERLARYYKSLGDMGFGRDITGFYTL